MIDITKPSALTTALRDAVKGIGGVLVGVGIISDAQLATVTGVIMFAVPAVYALIKQIQMARASL